MKRITIVIIATFVALMLVTGVAFAYFTFSQTIPNNTVSTGNLTFGTWGGPITASGLMPGGPVQTQYVAIQNQSGVDGRFKAYLGNFGGNTEIADKVMVTITANPGTGPYSFANQFGPTNVVVGTYALNQLMNPATSPIASPAYNSATVVQPTFGTVWKLDVFLDPSADNSYAGKSLTCDFVWLGGQADDPAF